MSHNKQHGEINSALYQIAEQANIAEDMQQFFSNIHNIISGITYAENFFIALYDEGHQSMSFPYIAEITSTLTTEDLANLPVETLQKTLTGYMLKTGKMLHANSDLMDQLTVSGKILEVGLQSNDWLGFPLKNGTRILGALVVQSYDKNLSYTEQDIDLLRFVSQHVANALAIKQSEEELKANELRLREVLENSNVISYKFNLKLNNYGYVSSNIKTIFGYSSEEYLAMGFAEAKKKIHPDDFQNYKQQFKDIISKSTVDNNYIVPVVEYRWRHNKDGKYHWFSDTRSVVFDEHNLPTAIIGSVRDISTIKDSEYKLRNTENALKKIQELENIGILAGGLAHDFNNILTGIFGNISLAKMQLSEQDLAFNYLTKAESSMDRATRLTRQLLTFAKGGSPIKEDVLLTKLIEETTLFDLTGSNVKPVFDFSKDVSEAHLDKGQIQQVISNLVINANQSMPEGGHLYIGVDMITLNDNQVAELNNGRYIKIEIRDEGVGIDERYHEQIFVPYFSTKTKGSGLGLTTVFSIIIKHNGHISFESELGKGTKFIIYLPAIAPVDLQQQDIEHQQFNGRENHKILVMDDDEDILDLVSAILEMNNFTVFTALDGQQMLEMYQQAMDDNEYFDAVIMDLTIPGGMGGKEAITELLNIDSDAKCIVSSGYADDPIMSNYQDYGFMAAIPKPYAIDILNNVLHHVLH